VTVDNEQKNNPQIARVVTVQTNSAIGRPFKIENSNSKRHFRQSTEKHTSRKQFCLQKLQPE